MHLGGYIYSHVEISEVESCCLRQLLRHTHSSCRRLELLLTKSGAEVKLCLQTVLGQHPDVLLPRLVTRADPSASQMKPRVDEAIAAFIDELEAIPDQLIQQPAFKLRRQVKALRQVVSDLEVPVASVLALNLECACPSVPGATSQRGADRVQAEEIAEYAAIQSYTKASPYPPSKLRRHLSG